MLPTLGVRMVIWYPDSNDISCRRETVERSTTSIRLPWPGLPNWALTYDIIVKNTRG
jgi:hypothetical protein